MNNQIKIAIIDQLQRQNQENGYPEFDAGLAGFKPAVLCIYEWLSYWLDLPGVDVLLVGTNQIKPVHGNLFHLRFENQLGLAKLHSMNSGKSVSEPVFVEVISRKFNTPQIHLEFYTSLLNDLFQRLARLPFTYQAPTGRTVVEALRPPTPLFTYHFLKQYGLELRSALNVILASPHRVLINAESFVPLAMASDLGPDTVLEMIQHSSQWQKAENHPLAKRLGGFVPARIMQHLPEETFDTPENRFILNFLRILQFSTGNLFTQSWWKYVPSQDRQTVAETHSLFQQSIAHPVFEEVGDQTILPLNSQVLLRKDGYRQMLTLWQKFQQARRPLFEPLHQAIEVRDVATLYEFWAFFALVEQIGSNFGIPPVLELNTSDEKGLEWLSKARFGSFGILMYNRTFSSWGHSNFHSYSTSMRPDYTWVVNDKVQMIFDAKFSLSSQDVSTVAEGVEDNLVTRPSLNDLYRMHTYRDALDLKAAVILNPGKTPVFFDRQRGKLSNPSLSECLSGDLNGIGAIPMRPGPKADF